MNIYSFLESSDIAAHCEKNGHQFNSLEMATIIAESSKPLKEKQAAWTKIISDFPDMKMPEYGDYAAKDSLHVYLRELITVQARMLAEFYNFSEDKIYSFAAFRGKKYGGWKHGLHCYSTFQKAWEAFNDYWHTWELNKVISAKFNKRGVNTDDGISVIINADGDVLEIYDSYKEYCVYSSYEMLVGRFYHLPVPFKKGDIVEYGDGEIGVLYNIPHWCEHYKKYISGKREDSFEMTIDYYRFCRDGMFLLDIGFGDLSTLRYFNGELKGRERFLMNLSQYIKDNNDSLDVLINVFCKLKLEAELEEANEIYDAFYRRIFPLRDNNEACIGPFFYINSEFISSKIPTTQGDKRGDKIDNPYSHEKLYDDHYKSGDYIHIPRGRVVWDSVADRAIIYIDPCIEKSTGAVNKIAEIFGLTDYVTEHDEHYVCPNCIGDIWA